MADRSLTLGTLFSANATQFFTTVRLMKKKVGELNATFMSVGTKGAKGVDKATKSVSAMGGAMDKVSDKAAKHKKSLRGVAGALDRIKTAAKITASFAAAAAAITAVTRSLAAGLKEMIDYDQGLKNLQAITNATDQEVYGMGETIKDVARTTKFSTAEVAEGMTLLGQAGFTATESMQAMDSVAKLATGTLSSMQFTADLMTTTIRAFGMSTVESAKAADIMANAINRSKLTIDKLRIAFNFVGAAAHQAGLTLEETAATMMVLANQGLRASTIGTGLRQVLSRLLSPTGRLREEFEANNIELNKVNPSLVGFRQALQNLLPVLYDHAEGTVDMAKAYRLFGLRGAQAAAVMTSAVASGNYDKMLELTYETGSAARMAAKQIEGLGLKIKNLADRARLIAVALGEAGLIGVLGAILDVLKKITTGIEDFIRSDFGQVTVQFIGWTIAILASTKALQLLMRMVKAASIAIMGLAKSMAAMGVAQTIFNASAKTGGGLIKVLMGSVRLLNPTFIAIAVAIGLVVTVIRRLVTATDRRIKAMQKEQAELTTQVQTLGLYIKVLEDLEKKQSKGADITKEHARAIKRMRGDSEKIIPVLKEQAEFLALNKEMLEEAYSSKLERAIGAQIELIKEQSKAVEQAVMWSGIWNMSINSLKIMWESFIKIMKNAVYWIKYITGGTILQTFVDWFDANTRLGKSFDYLGEKMSGSWKTFKDWVRSFAKESKGVVAATDDVNASLVGLARMIKELDKLKGGSKSLEDIVRQIELMTDKEINTATFDAIEQAIGDITLRLKEEQEEWKDTFDQLPIYFQEMYKDMDGLRKADFGAMIKTMQSKLAAWEKFAKQAKLTDEEITAGRAAIRARELAKFAIAKKKETKITEEAVDEQLEYLEILNIGHREMFSSRTKSLMNWYFKQVELAEGNKEKLLELEKTFNEQLKKEHKRLSDDLLETDKQRQAAVLQLEKQTVREIVKLHKKIMEDLKKQLRSQYDDLKKERDDFTEDLVDVDLDYEDTIRDIRQKTMTDEEKWLDDRYRATELMNRARKTSDTDLYKEAQSLFASLAREVRDESGDVIRTIESTSKVAEYTVNRVHREHTKLVKKEIRDREDQMEKLEDAIKRVDQQIKWFGQTIDAVNRKEMVIKADKTIKALEKVHTVHHKFYTEWELLKDKTIILTIKYNYVGKRTGGEGGATSTGEGGGEASTGHETSSEKGEHKTRSEKRWGGFIEKLMAAGGKLAGYGGGDKVHIAAEPGEYVVRKEAVKKYGGAIFESLNKMTAPDVMSSVGKRLGGIIGDSFRRFQFGGSVPAHAALQANQQTFNITVSPKYLTGDRQALRSIAKDVSKAIQEQSRRWGVK